MRTNAVRHPRERGNPADEDPGSLKLPRARKPDLIEADNPTGMNWPRISALRHLKSLFDSAGFPRSRE